MWLVAWSKFESAVSRIESRCNRWTVTLDKSGWTEDKSASLEVLFTERPLPTHELFWATSNKKTEG